MTLFKNDYSTMNDIRLNKLFDYYRIRQCTSEQEDQIQAFFNSLLN